VTLLKTKVWSWFDLLLLKWGVFLFGMIAGAFFPDFIMRNVWIILIAAVLLVIKPTLAYFKD
jgi:hypothetical protein